MNKLKNILESNLFYFLPIVYFILFQYNLYSNFICLKDIVLFSVVFFLITFALYFLLKKNIKYNATFIFIGFYCQIIFLFFGNFKDSFSSIPFLSSYKVFLLLIGIILILLIFFTKYKKNLIEKLYQYCNILMMLFCITSAITLFKSIFTNKNYSLEKSVLKNINPEKNISIHFILLDGYPGFFSLQKIFDEKNIEIKNFLTENNYCVFDTIYSNYAQTYYSLNSLLNMQYITYLHQINKNKYSSILQQLKEIKSNYITDFFSNKGYHIYNNSIFDINHSVKQNDFNKIKDAKILALKDVFYNRIYNDFAWQIKKYNDYETFKQYHYNNETIEHILNTKNQSPFFNYTHLLMPHEPYYTDSIGNLLSIDDAKKMNNEYLFKQYLKYTNRVIRAIAKNNLSKYPNDITIIMSDHGYREETALANDFDKFNNFLAVYFPDTNYKEIKKIHSNVNVFRTILNQYFMQNLSYLPDSLFSIDENKNKIHPKNLLLN